MSIEEYRSLNIAFEEAKRILDYQFDQINGLDTKASIIIGFSGALLTLFLTVLPSGLRYFDLLVEIGLLGAYVTLLTSLVFALTTITVKVYSNAPRIEKLMGTYLTWKQEDTMYDMLCACEQAIKENWRKINPKACMLRYSLASLEISICLTVATLTYQIWQFAQR